MVLVLKDIRLGQRPLPRLALMFWLAAFSVLNMPRAALVHLNNRITGSLAVKPEQTHVLISRCLQSSDCKFKVTENINNCRECGRCKVGAIKRVCNARGVTATVEAGGTSARKRLKERLPELVVAIACERELLAGILDTPLPVLGVIVQQGPQPCVDSDLKVVDFEERLNCVLKEV